MELAHGRGVDLQGQVAGGRVAPAHGQDLDLVFLNGRELIERELEALGFESETIRAGFCLGHPDVWMRCILDFGCAYKVLIFVREDVVHGLTADESSSAQRHVQLIASAVIIATCLAPSSRDLDSQKSSHNRWSKTIKSSVNMPPIEARVIQIIFRGDARSMEGLVMRMLQADVAQTFVFSNRAVADDLDLGLMRDGLQIRVEDAALGIEGLSVTVGGCRRVESTDELVLGCWGDVLLILEDEDLVGEEGVTDRVEVGILGGYRFHG